MEDFRNSWSKNTVRDSVDYSNKPAMLGKMHPSNALSGGKKYIHEQWLHLSMHRSKRSKWTGIQMVDESHHVGYRFIGLAMSRKELSEVSTKLHWREPGNHRSSRLIVNPSPEVSESVRNQSRTRCSLECTAWAPIYGHSMTRYNVYTNGSWA